MAKRKEEKHNRKKDRNGDNELVVKRLKAAIYSASKFLNTNSSDRDRGSFNDAATKLKVAGAITIKMLEEIGLEKTDAKTAFAHIGKDKISLTKEQKRKLIENGNTAAIARGNEFGLRLQAA